MNRQYGFFEYKKALLHYSEYGRGSKIMLCFHGYGQSNEYFKTLESVVGEEYRIFSFDLFYHGQSFWHEKEAPLTKEFWRDLLEKFLQEKDIKRFVVLGFSMGGKFALATLELFVERVENVILIAPDGVKTNFWYNLATYPSVLRNFFRNMIVRPSYYFTFVKIMRALRLVDKGVVRFANNQMTTVKQRRRVYYSWVVFRELKFDMEKIAFIFNQNNIKLEMYLGEYDKIVTHKNMMGLLEKLNDYQLFILKTGHSHLIEAVASHLQKNKTGI